MAAGLTPPNGATTQNPNPLIRMEFCGMTELQINYFRLKSSSGAIVATTRIGGDYWAEIRPDQALSDGSTYTVEADGRVNDSGTIKQIDPGTWAFTTGIPATDYIYHRNFEDTGFSIPHTFTQSEALSYFEAIGGAQGTANGNVSVVDDPSAAGGHGTVMKIDFIAYTLGAINTGCQIKSPIGNISDVYMAWDVYFPNSFVFPAFQKLLNLTNDAWTGSCDDTQMAQLPNVVGNNPDCIAQMKAYGHNVNPARLDGEVMIYEYDGVPTCRRNVNLGIAFQKGVWNKIEQHLKVNSSTSTADGEDEIWLNGSQIYSNTNRLWWGPSSTNQYIDMMMYIFYVGGSSRAFEHTQNQSVYIDNVIVSATPITH